MLQIMRCSPGVRYISKVAVIGGGQMGSGIAQVVAESGQNVTLFDNSKDSLTLSEQSIYTNLSKQLKKSNKDVKEVPRIMERIKFTLDIEEAGRDSDLIIEAVTEDLKVKQDIFSTLDKISPARTIFGTNTSSISVTEIGKATKRKDRFVGVHFFNPVPVLKLVELVRTKEVSDETYEALKDWLKSIGKTPIACKDTPGFIVNRLLFPLISEAIRMVERGDAEGKNIDEAMRLGCNHPMGPIQLADWIGHDTILSSSQLWHKLYPDNPLFEPLESQKELVNQGKLGTKTGEGYYKYKL